MFNVQHWHGILQSGTNYNDGTGFVTQCPIVPGDSYQYDFKVSDQVRVITGTNFLLITASARLEHSGTTHMCRRSTEMG